MRAGRAAGRSGGSWIVATRAPAAAMVLSMGAAMGVAMGVGPMAVAQMHLWPRAAAARTWESETSRSVAEPAAAAGAASVAEPTAFRTADELLAALERADRGLETLTAEVRYDRTFELQGDAQTRFGRLWFENGGERRRFAILFDELLVGNVQRRQEQQFVFDGEWLVERVPSERRMIKQQVVPPGRSFDPLRLGSGPLPIPIGQKREDILSRYEAELAPSSAGLEDQPGDGGEGARLRGFVEGSWQVVLRPRAEVADEEDFREVRLWYSRSSSGRLLPRMARTVNRAGDVACVMLINVRLREAGGVRDAEAEVPAGLFDTRTPADGWLVDVRPWRGGE